MRLDEKTFDDAWKVWLDCADVQQMDRDSALKRGIETYLSSTVPGDVRENVSDLECLARWLDHENLEMNAKMIRKIATALLTLSAENAELKARLDGTVGVEILEK